MFGNETWTNLNSHTCPYNEDIYVVVLELPVFVVAFHCRVSAFDQVENKEKDGDSCWQKPSTGSVKRETAAFSDSTSNDRKMSLLSIF